LQDALIAQLHKAALVEHNPAIGIVRIDWSRWGTPRDEVVMGIVHHEAGSMTPWAGGGAEDGEDGPDKDVKMTEVGRRRDGGPG
jgi:hypothetical protein